MANWTLESITQDAKSGLIQVEGMLDMTAVAVVMEPAALDDRMTFYGLATRADALDAILREHAARIARTAPATGTPQEMMGGLDATVGLTWSADAASQRDTLLAALPLSAQG